MFSASQIPQLCQYYMLCPINNSYILTAFTSSVLLQYFNNIKSCTKGTLHSKLAQIFFAGLKVCIFGKFLRRKRSWLMPWLLRYFWPKCAERCRRLIRSPWIYHQLYLELLNRLNRKQMIECRFDCFVDCEFELCLFVYRWKVLILILILKKKSDLHDWMILAWKSRRGYHSFAAVCL